MNFEERLKQGPLAVIECPQKIPCNPCETSCPNKAITIGEDITTVPQINYEKCSGCGLCLRSCPGLAIFLLNGRDNEITIPYELLPLPSRDEWIYGLDRTGQRVCEVKVIRVLSFPSEKKNLVTFSVPPTELMNIRHIELKNE